MPNALRPLLLLVALVAVAPAQAREDAAPRTVPREDAGARVRQVERDGGRVLQAEPMQRGGRQVYRLKVLTPEGRVRVLDESRGREPTRRESRFQRNELPGNETIRPGTLLRDRPRTRDARSAPQDMPRPSPREEDPRTGDGF
jgi:hypothetical protein